MAACCCVAKRPLARRVHVGKALRTVRLPRCLSLRGAPALVALSLITASSALTFAADEDPVLARAAALVARGEYDLASKEIASLKASGKRAGAELLEARIQLGTGFYAKAAATAKAAASRGKQAKIEAAAIRADALARLGKTSEAIAVLKEVAGEDDARRARLLLGELLIATGKRGEARAPLISLVEDYNDDRITATDAEGLTMLGRATHLLRSPRDANDAFNQAEKAGGKERVETLLWRADLFLDKYDPGHAGAVIKEALALAPRDPEARVLMARVKLESSMDFNGAESELNQALDVNPNLASAHVVRAGLALRDLDIAAADAAIDRGLRINPRDLELLSMKAAARFLADDKPGFEAVKKQVFAQNPEYSGFYQIVSELAEWEHRYDDIVRMMREAIAIDERDAKAHATLGLNLIRAGDEDAGLDALVRELESALIPVNRAAARRALARLHRETERARDAGTLEALLFALAEPEAAELPQSAGAPAALVPTPAPAVAVPAVTQAPVQAPQQPQAPPEARSPKPALAAQVEDFPVELVLAGETSPRAQALGT